MRKRIWLFFGLLAFYVTRAPGGRTFLVPLRPRFSPLRAEVRGLGRGSPSSPLARLWVELAREALARHAGLCPAGKAARVKIGGVHHASSVVLRGVLPCFSALRASGWGVRGFRLKSIQMASQADTDYVSIIVALYPLLHPPHTEPPSTVLPNGPKQDNYLTMPRILLLNQQRDSPVLQGTVRQAASSFPQSAHSYGL